MSNSGNEKDDLLAVQRFREYLMVPTEQPTPDYAACRDFLVGYAREVGLESWEHEVCGAFLLFRCDFFFVFFLLFRFFASFFART
jgi:hypothetical protein